MPPTFNRDRTAATPHVLTSASGSSLMPVRQSRQHACIGALLVRRRVITDAQLQAALEQQQINGRRLAQVLVEMGVTTQDVVTGALAVQLNMHGARAGSEQTGSLTPGRT